LRKSIDAASEFATAQRQLRAQFKASGLDLAKYNQRIVDTSLATSRLSGFTETDLVQSFTNAFRGSQNVSAGLKIQSIAADVARGRHIDLSVATIALTKAYGGQTTALRRLGIQVPTNLRGFAALEFVQRRFAGQAQAGTTAQQRFGAALHNTEVSIGNALLPSLTKYLNKATVWLDQSKNQKRIQTDLAKTIRITAAAFGLVSHSVQGYIILLNKLSGAASAVNRFDAKILGALGLGGGKPGTVNAPSGVRGPIGSRTTPSAFPFGLTGPLGTVPKTGLAAQLRQSQLALAKAQVTVTQADDRRVLADQAKIIRAAISITTNLKKRTELYQQLGTIENQIRQIDQDAATKQTDAQRKILEARKRQLENDKRAAQQELSLLKQRESKLKDRI
jgi:hypothetical protein